MVIDADSTCLKILAGLRSGKAILFELTLNSMVLTKINEVEMEVHS